MIENFHMNIVHVCLLGNFGEKYAYQDNILPKYHRSMGHEVTIIAPTYSEFDKSTGKIKNEKPGKSIIYDGIKLIRLAPIFPVIINEHVHAFIGLKRTLYRISPDFIFVHGLQSLTYRVLKDYKKAHPKVNISFDNHADLNNSCKSVFSFLFTKYIIRPFVANYVKDISSNFYGVTPARCTFLHEMYGIPSSKISLLPLGADDQDMDFSNKDEIRRNVRSEYNIAEDEFLIVTGGKIDPLKNVHTLANAISRSPYKKIKIIIFGSIRDDLKDFFYKIQSDRVLCVGWISSNDVYKYFYASDLAVFPGLHSVLWEQAVASRVPCAFKKIEGFDHVNIGGNCILMEDDTEDYYQKLIENLYIDKSLYRRMYVNSQSDMSTKFLYSQIASKVICDLWK